MVVNGGGFSEALVQFSIDSICMVVELPACLSLPPFLLTLQATQ